MTLIDLCAKNPYSHEIGKKVMGFDYNRGSTFICGTVIGREHHGSENAYIIESEHGKDYSGTLYENSIVPYDEKVVLEEIRKDNRLTVRILYCPGFAVIVEKDKKEIFWQNIDAESIEPADLLKSYEKLLEFFGFKPDMHSMCDSGSVLVLQFEKEMERNGKK